MSNLFNLFDLIFLFSGFVFLLIAFFRGFVREVFSLLAWLISLFLVIFISPILAKFLASYTKGEMASKIVASLAVFILSYVVSSVIFKDLSEKFRKKLPLVADQILGLVFAAFKTLLIFGFVYAASFNLNYAILKKRALPSWIEQAKTKPLIAPFGKMLSPLVKKALNGFQEDFVIDKFIEKKIEEKSKKTIEEKIGNYEKVKRKGDSGALQDVDLGKNYEDQGYDKDQIEKMERLMEIIK